MKRLGIFVLTCLMIFTFSLKGEKVDRKEAIEVVERTKLSYDAPGSRSHSIFPFMAEFEEDGKKMIMFVWSEETGLQNIYYCKKENKPNAKWSAPARASFTNGVNSKTPHIAVDPNRPDVVHLVWADGQTRNNKYIFHRHYTNKKWTVDRKILIPHPNNDSFPRIDFLCDGTINCVWEFVLPNPVTKQYDNTYLRGVNTWTINENWDWDAKGHGLSTNKNYHATHADIASRGLRSYAVWQEGEAGHRVIMFAEKIQKEGEDDHWSWPIQISTEQHSFWPKIAVDSRDNLHVMWGELRGEYGFRSRIFGEWYGPPSILNYGFANRHFFEIDCDANDMLHAAFRGDGVNIYYSYKSANNLGPWTREVKITENCNDCSHATILARNSSDYVHIGYSDVPAGASHSKDVVYVTLKKLPDPITDYPKADFTMSTDSTTLVIGTAVSFDASPSKSEGGNIDSYHWNFGDFYDDHYYEEGKNVTHTFKNEGNYKVILSVLDRTRNLIGTKSVTFEVISGPMPPTNVVVSTLLNRGFLYRDWVNKIEWQENPQNANLGFSTEGYKIYRKQAGVEGDWIQIADISPSTTYYFDRGFTSAQDAQKYAYGVSIIAGGMESEIGMVSSSTQQKRVTKDTKENKKN